MTDLVFLDKIKAADCEFSARVDVAIRRAYGADATLGDVVRGGGADALLKQRNFGRRCAQEVRDMLEYATSRPPEIEALLANRRDDREGGQGVNTVIAAKIRVKEEKTYAARITEDMLRSAFNLPPNAVVYIATSRYADGKAQCLTDECSYIEAVWTESTLTEIE